MSIQARIDFANSFVDRVTVRPFLADLKRMKDNAEIYRPLPRIEDVEDTEQPAANVA